MPAAASNPGQTPRSMSPNTRIGDSRESRTARTCPAASPCTPSRRNHFPALADCHDIDGMHHMRLTLTLAPPSLALAPPSSSTRKPELPHAILATSPELITASPHLPRARSSAAGSVSIRAHQPAARSPAADEASRPVQSAPYNQSIVSSRVAGTAPLGSKGERQAGPRPRAGQMLNRSAAAQTAAWALVQGLASSTAAKVTGPGSAATMARSTSTADGTSLYRTKSLNPAHCPERNGLSSIASNFSVRKDHLALRLVRRRALLMMYLMA